MDILPSYDIWAGEVLVEGGDEVGNMDWRTLAPEDWDDPAAAPGVAATVELIIKLSCSQFMVDINNHITITTD